MLRANVGHDELQQRTLDVPRPGAQVEDAQLTLDARRGEPSFFVLVDPRTAWAIRVRAFANASAPILPRHPKTKAYIKMRNSSAVSQVVRGLHRQLPFRE